MQRSTSAFENPPRRYIHVKGNKHSNCLYSQPIALFAEIEQQRHCKGSELLRTLMSLKRAEFQQLLTQVHEK